MKIWIVNHYADPPDGMATRSFDIGRRLVERNNPTTIFTSNFSHYRFGRMRRLGWGRLWQQQGIEGVRFIWIQTTGYRMNDWRRTLNMLSFCAVCLLAGLFKRERPDVIVGVTVHPLAALVGYWLARMKRARFLLEVTDLWPQSLVDLGRLREGSMSVRFMRRLERFLFQRAERIIMLWRHTDSYVEQQGVPSAKILWLPHGVELNRYGGLKPYDGSIGRDVFWIVYLGAFVESMALENILDAASLLQGRGRSDIRFRMIGAGTYREQIMSKARSLRLENVEFPPAVPKNEIALAMSDADAFIYGLRDAPIYRYGMSLNKLSDYLASGRPIIYYGRSTYDPVSEVYAGFTVPPNNPAALAEAIQRLVALAPEERVAMGARGRAYLEEHHNIPVLADRLLRALGQA